MIEVKEVAQIFRSIYENEMEKLEITYFSSFPKNCCEGASFFFGLYIMYKFPNSTIEIVKGTNDSPADSECHIWVEVDGLVFDLTADQFEGIDEPIYGKELHPLSKVFVPQSRKYLSCYYSYYTKVALEPENVSRIYSNLLVKVEKQLMSLGYI